MGLEVPRVELVNPLAFSWHFLFQNLCWLLKMQRKRGTLQN